MIQHVNDHLYIGNLRGYQDCDLDVQFLALTHKAVPRGVFQHIDMVDSNSPDHFHLKQFELGIEFMKKAPTLVFCDQGGSRSPSMAMLYMSLTGQISNKSYFSACRDFTQVYPWFKPNTGIRTYMYSNWDLLQFRLSGFQP